MRCCQLDCALPVTAASAGCCLLTGVVLGCCYDCRCPAAERWCPSLSACSVQGLCLATMRAATAAPSILKAAAAVFVPTVDKTPPQLKLLGTGRAAITATGEYVQVELNLLICYTYIWPLTSSARLQQPMHAKSAHSAISACATSNSMPSCFQRVDS